MLVPIDKYFNSLFETLPQGWLTKPEAELLWSAGLNSQGPILEVGSYRGRSTVLLHGLYRPVYAVDPFTDFDSTTHGDEILATLQENLRERNIVNVQIFRQRIEDWKVRPCGFAYLDGDHTYIGTLAQLDICKQCGVQRFCIHDYATSGGGLNVKQALEARKVNIIKIVERMAYCEFTNPTP